MRSSCDFEQAKRYRRTVDRRWQRLAAGFERQGIGKAMLCFASMLIAATAVAAPPPCMPLEPASVTLHGRMVSLVLPGAPNYERILGGDEPEKYFYVQLDAPIRTIGANDDWTDSEPLQCEPLSGAPAGEASIREQMDIAQVSKLNRTD